MAKTDKSEQKAAERRARLAQALKANLKRRKTQARGRAGDTLEVVEAVEAGAQTRRPPRQTEKS